MIEQMVISMPPIAGLQKLSLQDFPGTPAAIVFTRGCNLSCAYCHNPELLGAGDDLDPPWLADFFWQRRHRLAGVVVTGGEPTLHPELTPMLHTLRQWGYRIKLDSNGQRPHVIEALVAQGLIDYLALDWKMPAAHYGRCGGHADAGKRLQRCAAAARAAGLPFEWRTTVVSPWHDAGALDQIAHEMVDGDQWCLQAVRTDQPLWDPGADLQPPPASLLSDAVVRHPRLRVIIR